MALSAAALQQFALLKGYDLDGMDPTSADFIHTIVEASKLAFADREAFYGDPNFVHVPTETLLSDAYNAERRKLMTDRAFLAQMQGYGLTTVQIHYYMPDHRSLLQQFVMQQYDVAPSFPELDRFLGFWRREIEAVLQDHSNGAIQYSASLMLMPLRFAQSSS